MSVLPHLGSVPTLGNSDPNRGGIPRGIAWRSGLAAAALAMAHATGAMADPAGAALAEALRARAGIGGGLVAVPGSADEVALEWAKKPNFIVYAMASGTAAVAATRAQAMAAGLLDKSLYIEQRQPDRLPLADRTADCVVATQLSDGDLTAALSAEWRRVLAPGRGVAVVGRSSAAGSGLAQTALENWAAAAGWTGATATSGTDGLWLVWRRPLDAGMDEWTHRQHGPDNTGVSADTTLRAPFLTHWLALPIHEGFWGTTAIVGGGRQFTLWASRTPAEGVSLIARSIANGTALWKKQFLWNPRRPAPYGLAAGFFSGRSCMAAMGDKLLITDTTGDAVLELDAETGTQTQRIVGPTPGGQIKWIGAADGVLALLSGGTDAFATSTLQSLTTIPYGREVAAYSLGSGTSSKLWPAGSSPEAGDVDQDMLAIKDGKLYYYVKGVGGRCRDLQTGADLWLNNDPATMTLIESGSWRNENYHSSRSILMVCSGTGSQGDTVITGARWLDNYVALDAATGQKLWSKPKTVNGRTVYLIPYQGKYYNSSGGYDLRTGTLVDSALKASSDSCGPPTAAPGYFLGGFGSATDTATRTLLRTKDVKSPCDIGSVIGDGVVVNVAGECRCNLRLQGYRAVTGGTDQLVTADRFQAGGAGSPAALVCDASDWTTGRHDETRRGSTPAAVGGKPTLQWRWRPAVSGTYTPSPKFTLNQLTTDQTEFRQTAAISAAGLTWFGSADGVVRCVDSATGAERWNFPTGAKLYAPPTIAPDGRLYCGGGDGYLYCLSGTSGAMLWRFRAAPYERRIMTYGHLTSAWPLIGGALVRGGTVYTVAGFSDANKIHSYALNGTTGTVIWEKHDASNGGSYGIEAGYASVGNMCIGGGRLWLASSTIVPGSFDLATGSWAASAVPGSGGNNALPPRGQYIGFLADGWLLTGGRRVTDTHDLWAHDLKEVGVRACMTLVSGTAFGKFGVDMLPESPIYPVWDDDQVLAATRQSGQWQAWNRASLVQNIQQTSDAFVYANIGWQPFQVPDLTGGAAYGGPSGAQWGPVTVDAISAALAKDSLVLAHAPVTRDANYRISSIGSWQIGAVDRANGQKLWSVLLPEQPSFDSVSIDRNGRILVALRDGSIAAYSVPPGFTFSVSASPDAGTGVVGVGWPSVSGTYSAAGYKIERKDALDPAGAWVVTGSVGSGVLSAQDKPVTGTYVYRVTASDSAGDMLYRETATAAGSKLPTSVTAVSGSNNSVALNWADLSNESGYVLERSLTSGTGFTPLQTLAANALVHTDTTGTPGRFYWYRLRATTAFGAAGTTAETSTVPQGYTVQQAWRNYHGLAASGTGSGADTADPDKDGLANLIEYGLGTRPTTAAAGDGPASANVGGKLQIQFGRNPNATDLTYEVQASTDLVNWTTLATRSAGGSGWVQNGATVTETGVDTVSVTVTDNASTASYPRRVMRLKVSK